MAFTKGSTVLTVGVTTTTTAGVVTAGVATVPEGELLVAVSHPTKDTAAKIRAGRKRRKERMVLPLPWIILLFVS